MRGTDLWSAYDDSEGIGPSAVLIAIEIGKIRARQHAARIHDPGCYGADYGTDRCDCWLVIEWSDG